jgi:hypothetical protein
VVCVDPAVDDRDLHPGPGGPAERPHADILQREADDLLERAPVEGS